MVQQFGNYALHCVYGQVDADLQAEIIAFWMRNQAIIDGILRSAAQGREVTIDIPDF